MASRYWSCSKFADWLRGTAKPLYGTSEEWRVWEKTAKKRKLRYWLAEEGLDYLEDFVCWPANRINDFRCYFNNRWVTKSHALTSNLKRGSWYDFDTRLLNTVFDELVNFVEIELAWMCVVFSDEEREKYKPPRYRIGSWRSPEAGLAYLKWASELKFNEDLVNKNDPNYDQPTPQAIAAQETLILYKWWKEEYPKRPNPSEASGWSKYCKQHIAAKTRSDDSWSGSFITNKKEDDEILSNLLNLCRKIENEQEEEDSAMLIRLIKIRHSLWT